MRLVPVTLVPIVVTLLACLTLPTSGYAAAATPAPTPSTVSPPSSSEPSPARYATAWLLITAGVIAVGAGMSQAGVRSAFRNAGLLRRGSPRP